MFKIGDKVRRIDIHNSVGWAELVDEVNRYNVFTVTAINSEGYIKLKGCGELFLASRFKLAENDTTDPILKRINILYKKCKTTQHWKINESKSK